MNALTNPLLMVLIISLATGLPETVRLAVADETTSMDQGTKHSSDKYGADRQVKHKDDHKLKDAWLDGKLEVAYALNRHLNPFRIDTKVENGVAYLSGTVESEIDKDLAEQVALSIKGITRVESRLTVDSKHARKKGSGQTDVGGRTLLQRIDDAMITAAVKTKLLTNSNVKGLAINVDTNRSIVTLSGSVRSSAEKDLAELLAKNTDGVKDVKSKLAVSTKPSKQDQRTRDLHRSGDWG